MPAIYTVAEKTCDWIFYNNLNNKCPITIIFGTLITQSMRHLRQSVETRSQAVTPSTFHSRLKTHLFHKSFLP